MTDKEINDTQWRDYRAMLQTRRSAVQMGLKGMDPWPPAKAARLMAIVTVWGNNEGFTLSPKFQIDREYIQDVYNIKGGRTPDNDRFNSYLRHYTERMEQVESDEDPYFLECADWIREMYNFKLLC